MRIRSTLALALVAGGSAVAGEALLTDGTPIALARPADTFASAGVACSPESCSHGAPAEIKAAAFKLIEAQTFHALPEQDRAVIAQKLEERGQPVPAFPAALPQADMQGTDIPLTEAELDEAYARVADFVTREAFETFSPVHQRMAANLADMVRSPDWAPVQTCFVPGTNPEVIMAFEEIISFGLSNMQATNPMAFEQTSRWNATALDPNGGGQGNPTILTYSFPPDGTTVPSGVGEPSAPNNLNAFLDGIYGNRATWRAIYDDIFAVWGDVSGNTYVLEPNDDGAALDFSGADSAPGIAGVRGDMRMTGKPIDGNSGTLAYNFFPQRGDMVIDTADGFYTNTSGNSLRLRNVLWHEHGHGMGQLHTCPVTNSKLMEPFINLNFVGPQFDDILNAQRHYGDPNEPNDNAASATGIGTLGIDDSTTVRLVSLDDDTDVDFYSFTLSQASEVTVTLRPQGGLYQAGPQTSSCNESQPYNPLLFLDPAVAIIGSNGTTVIASANNAGLGGDETVSASLAAGTYFVRASASNPSGDQIIAYELDVTAQFDGLSYFTDGDLPSELAPGVPTSFEITISPDGEAIVGTPEVLFRPAGASTFSAAALINTDGNLWQVNLPAFACGQDPEYIIQTIGSVTGLNTLPASGTQQTIVSDGTVVAFDDNGQVDLGYTVTGNASDGQWQLGVPVNNGRGDPATDFDGSGSCWLTDNTSATSNSDVDNGETILTSPPIDLLPGSTVDYAYWFNDVPNGQLQGGDSFRVLVSTNGGASYTVVRTVTTALGAWRTDTLVEGVDYIGGAAGQGRLRFIANDIGTQNVVEAAVDAIRVTVSSCTDPAGCNAADLAEPFGSLTFADISAFLAAFSSQDPAADLAAPAGQYTFADISAFLAAFSAGCP